MTKPLFIWNTGTGMDISPQRVNDAVQIEQQVAEPGGSSAAGPTVISESVEKDKSVFINLLAGLGITVVSTVAVILLMVIPFTMKKTTPPTPVVTTSTLQVGSQTNIIVQSEYINPFDSSSQYTNPFIASVNPFASLTQ